MAQTKLAHDAIGLPHIMATSNLTETRHSRRFFTRQTTLGTGTLNNGTATYSTSALAVGSHSITAVYGGDGNCSGSTSPAIVQTVNKAPLTITADDKSKLFGGAMPLLTASYSGFANDDGPACLTTAQTLSTTANIASPVGTYPITASGAVAANYEISYVAGTLTVNPRPPGEILDVFIWVTIQESVHIAWGDGTTGKTAGDITPLDWTVKDAGGDQLGQGETCVSNDVNNNVTINLENTSNTGTNARVSAAVANSGGWAIGSTPATDKFVIQGQLGTNPLATLAAGAQELTTIARLAKGSDQPLVLTVMTPTAITQNGGVQKTMFVALTATPE